MEETFCSVESLLSDERSGILCSQKFLSISKNITEKMRMNIIDWFISMTPIHEIGIQPDVFFSAVNMFDAYISRNSKATKKDLELIILSSLLLSWKYLHHQTELDKLSKKSASISDLLYLEKNIFKCLGCKANITNEMNFLRFLIAKVDYDSMFFDTMSKNLLMIISINNLDWLPSVLVTTVIEITSEIYKEKFVNAFEIPQPILLSCRRDIINCCKTLKFSKLSSLKNIKPINEWTRFFTIVCELPQQMTTLNISTEKYTKNFYFRENLEIPLLSLSLLPQELSISASDDFTSLSNLALLGSGNFGDVYKVKYNGNNYAVKKNTTSLEEGIPFHFVREISLLRSFKHDNILKLEGLTEDINCIFLKLGESDLGNYIEKNGVLDYKQQLNLSKNLIGAIAYMHDRGCLHRDIKPENIILFRQSTEDKSNTKFTFVLGDLGSCRGPEMPVKNDIFSKGVGSLQYKSPELLLGARRYGPEIDIWSIMCTLYQCGTGHQLFSGQSENEQILQIFSIFGTPTEKIWPGVSKLEEYKKLSMPFLEAKVLLFDKESLSNCYKKLLRVGFVLSPSKRPSANDLYKIVEEYI